MSRVGIYTDIFAMLSDMTTANGYAHDYTPVKSVYNSSATMKQTPYISIHTEHEEAYDGETGWNETRAVLPFLVTARVKVNLPPSKGLQKFRKEVEYEEDIERAKVIDDIKRRFSFSATEISQCVKVELDGEIDPESNGLMDSNKHDMFVQYRFLITYKQTK